MLKPFLLSYLFILFFSARLFSQCIIPLAAPDCTGSEPLVADGETIGGGLTKWYYGTAALIDNLTLDGGTLVVCGDLTVDKFYMTSGTIFIRPGGRFVIGSGIGAGLQFKGGCAIYNYGTCEIRRNLSLENNATALSPNIVVNALSTSVFKMSNQYFVINNPFSWFVNNGSTECWGIITDNQATAGSVCLGPGSSTSMAVLINKVANAYTVPSSHACVHVFQYSEFYGALTSSPNLYACLASSHVSATSCIPFGCQPDNWGSAQVVTDCTACTTLTFLGLRFETLSAKLEQDRTVLLEWDTNDGNHAGVFYVLRSSDGKNFHPVDSLNSRPNGNSRYRFLDHPPSGSEYYYQVRYSNDQNGTQVTSHVARISLAMNDKLAIFPVPFTDHFQVRLGDRESPERVMLTDVNGGNIRISYEIRPGMSVVDIRLAQTLSPGMYIVHIQTGSRVMAKTLFKE